MVEIKNSDGHVIAYGHDKGGCCQDKVDLHTPGPFRYPATTNELMEYATEFFLQCKSIAMERNKRYATPNNPFKNFKLAGEYGIVVRASDKISRLLNLTEPGNTITDGGESVEDTCRDLCNYMMLLSAMRSNERGGK